MIKKIIIILIVLTGTAINAFSENLISFTIPDSPDSYTSNTWDVNNWTEIDVGNKGFIIDWSIVYTWTTDSFPGDASFHVLSPSGTIHTIASGEPGGTYTVSSNSFNYEPVKGTWRLWVEDFWGDGGCGAVDITISIVLIDSYLIVNVPEKAAEGMESITGTVIVNPAPEKDMIILLNSNNTERLAVQSEATIKSGEGRTYFSMTIVDDELLNLSSEIQIHASAPGYYTGTGSIKIDDNESASITLMLPDQVMNEDTIQAKICVDRNLYLDTMIPLLINTTNVNIQPETVLMPAGLSEVTFDLMLFGENIAQTISITPSVENWTVYSDTISFIPRTMPESERQALIDFFNSTGGQNWNNNENWLGARGTECTWFGVFCDESDIHVTKIEMSDYFSGAGNNLKGDILPSICNLKYLSVLSLYNNQLSSLPENFGNLQSLSNLYLDTNQLSSLPESFGNLQSLAFLSLSNNQLSSLPESFGDLQYLYNLNLFNNQLSSLPESFGNLQSLSDLNLSNNQLSSLPESFVDLQYLTYLYLNHNQLSSLPESFGNLQFLIDLNLLNNQLNSLPESFGDLHITYLYLSNNQLSKLPESFGNLSNLSILDLAENQINNFPTSFENLLNLSKLYLNGNQLTILPQSFGNLQNLKILDLSYNALRILPESFVNLQNLSILNLEYNQLQSLPERIGDLIHLTEIDLCVNQLQSLPESIGNLHRLFDLELHNNQLNSLPDSFGNLSNLLNLELYNNQLTRLPDSFGNLSNLLSLEIFNNQLRSLSSENFSSLTKLSLLNLSNNQLSSLPQNFSLLQSLTELYLSINQLTHLPENFENLTNIKFLDISVNQLKILPDNIGNIKNLIVLNVSTNQIQKLPDSIGNLYNLNTLNVSYNQLPLLPLSMGNIATLQEFNASSNALKSIPDTIQYLTNLQTIALSDNQIQATFPDMLWKIENLQELDLSKNEIEYIENNIPYKNNIKILNISDNQIFELPDTFTYLTKLQDLNLSDCYFRVIPPQILLLSNLQNLYLNNNQIEQIPENLDILTHLSTLSIENNMIQDNINTSLCNITSLRSLDLSGNKFIVPDIGLRPMHGDIPIEFTKLKNLVFLDISDTKLYTSSPLLEQFITEKTNNWINYPPEKPQRKGLCIKYITAIGESLTYSQNAKIPLQIVMTQPVFLSGGNMIVTLETGEIDQEVFISPFALTYTATGIYTVHEGDFSKGLNVKSIILANGASLTNENGEAVDLTLIPEINMAEMKNIYVDGTIPSLEITDPNNPCEENLYKITGTAADNSKDFSVALTIFDEQNNAFPSEVKNFYKNVSENWAFDTSQFNLQKDASYRIQVVVKDFSGNTNTISRAVTFGRKTSTIIPHLSQNTIVLGQTIMITGNISPPESLIGEEVIIKLISPSGKEPGRKVNANEDGSFEYTLQCNDIDQAGLWQVVALWDGTSCLDPAVSDPQILTVEKAPCQVGLDATQISVKLGDKVSITGQVLPEPYCEGHMINIPVDLMVSGPKGINEIELQTTNTAGQFKQSNYTGFDTLGEWQIVASVKNNSYLSSFSDMVRINVVETAGYAIIVQGKIAAEEGLASHNKTANDVYHHLKLRGLLDEDILYFNYDTEQASYKITDQILNQLSNEEIPENIVESLDDIKDIEFTNEELFVNRLKTLDEQVMQFQSQILEHCILPIEIDGLPTKAAIKKAITEDMPKIMKNQPANLYIVMVDHGTEDTFYIEPDTISDVELNAWLTELENTPGWDQEIVVMLGFCFSGSFIDELSKPNRVIISSAGPNEFSFKGPLDQDNIREGEFFISEFFKSVALGKNVKESFAEAVIQTEIFTAKGEGSVNAPPYFDNSAQHPLLDDNGDKMGSNNVMESSADGDLAKEITIGVSSLTMNDPGDVIITDVSDTIFLKTDEATTDKLWAKVSDPLRLLTLWIEIKPPNFVPNAVGTGQVEMDLPKIVTINLDETTKQYHWDASDLDNMFDIPGTYHIYYFAKDSTSKNVSPMKESIVYKASSVNHAPEAFHLLYPRNGIEITSLGVLASLSADPTAEAYTMLSWEETTDPDNDRLSYTLFFSKDNERFDDTKNRIKLSNLTDNFHEINLPEDWDGSTVYWKVQAIDKYGAITESGINHFMINNANNPSNGTLWGYVYDAATNKPVQRVGIAVKSGGSLIKRMMTMSTGKYFSAFRPLSNYHIVVEKEGYEVIEKSPVNVPKDDRCRLDFYLVADTSNIPQLSEISSQTINEGESFVPISLDNYITDGNNEKHEIIWSASGNTELNVTIDDSRTASITISNKDWFGAETIIFSAEDPEGNKGDTSATFTIKGVNDAPVVTNIPDQIIYDFSTFQPIILDNCVIDVDHAVNEITWETMGQKNLMVSINDRIAKISLSDKQWRGYENIMFTATDPSGDFGVKMAMFTVLNSGFVYDLNNNGTIDLGDMIMVLQIFTNVYVDKEWISDQQIGFDDLLFIINRISKTEG
jgi:Leucine-rich repeat (LRR) protein